MGTHLREGELPLKEFEKQVVQVIEAIRKEPAKERQILILYLSSLFDGIKDEFFVTPADIGQMNGCMGRKPAKHRTAMRRFFLIAIRDNRSIQIAANQ